MKKTFFFGCFSLLFLGALMAQNNLSDIELDLINRSIEKSYALKKSIHELSIDSLEKKTIRQNFIPTLELDAKYGYGSSRINVDVPTVQLPITGIELFEGETRFDAQGQVFNTSLTAKALLFSGLQVNYGSKATEEKIKAKNFMLHAEKSEIIKDVIETFDKIELLKNSEVVITKSEERLAKEKERVKTAIKNGLAIPYDRNKITAAEFNLASKKVELYGNLSLLYLKLSMMTDVSIETLEQYSFELQPWKLQIHNNTFNDRPELKALDASVNAYDYKVKMNRNSILPKLQAVASVSYSNLFNANLQTPYSLPGGENVNLELNKFELYPSYFLGVGMQWDIFSGLKHSNETRSAQIEKSIAEEEKNDVREKLSLFAKKMQVDFEVKNQQLFYKEQEMIVAENSLNIATKSYHQGLISISDLLETETEYQTASLNYYTFIVQQRMAALDLLISTGSLHIEHLNH
ncbi:TolC family protein [Algibacter mikhailovii]|uniref:TolC family protein n=1 Tax=Algibacter mikhailovii TaxID=425498 RepID=UPI0024945038|nr:TolC family protein [Algibacter mikhailovii]